MMWGRYYRKGKPESVRGGSKLVFVLPHTRVIGFAGTLRWWERAAKPLGVTRRKGQHKPNPNLEQSERSTRRTPRWIIRRESGQQDLEEHQTVLLLTTRDRRRLGMVPKVWQAKRQGPRTRHYGLMNQLNERTSLDRVDKSNERKKAQVDIRYGCTAQPGVQEVTEPAAILGMFLQADLPVYEYTLLYRMQRRPRVVIFVGLLGTSNLVEMAESCLPHTESKRGTCHGRSSPSGNISSSSRPCMLLDWSRAVQPSRPTQKFQNSYNWYNVCS
jgi:hypothetical protein